MMYNIRHGRQPQIGLSGEGLPQPTTTRSRRPKASAAPPTWLPRQYLQGGDDPSETYFTLDDGSVELIQTNDSGGIRLPNRVRKQRRRQRILQAGSPKARWKFCDARYNPNMVSCFKAFLTVAPQHYSCSIPNYQSRIPRSCGQPEGPGSSSAAAFHAPTTFRIAHPDFGI